jgi:hypothetical protein
VAGRWFGVRGRRFVRPTLILRRDENSAEVRALADLEHKPWAADEGAHWMAAFSVDMTLQEAATVELSVAPDITIALARPDTGPLPAGERIAASGSPSSPLAKAVTGRRRPATLGTADADRVTARLAAAGNALQRERDRRSAAERALESERDRRAGSERALEEERAEGRRLRLELGQLEAELELSRTGQSQASDVATELEALRQELLAAQRQSEELARERDRAARAHAETRTALHERTGALESARQALAAEQAEVARLRGRQPREAADPPRGGGPSSDADIEAEPDADSIGRRMSAVIRGADAPASYGSAATGYHSPPASSTSEGNPWVGRGLALLFLIGVIVAIVLVVQGTVA